MNTLVERLSSGDHAVEIALRPTKNVQAFKECVDRGFVHVKFPNTQGGTELGFKLDPRLTDLEGAHFDDSTGSATLVGELTLDYVKVRCIANIDLSTLNGTGHLEVVN